MDCSSIQRTKEGQHLADCRTHWVAWWNFNDVREEGGALLSGNLEVVIGRWHEKHAVQSIIFV